MIKRIFIDNYKCFTNFECRLDAMQLLLGDNGTGRTSVFDVLGTLRDFITQGVPAGDAFQYKNLTAWETRPLQAFELGLEGNSGQYVYRLVIEHDRGKQRNRIQSEELRFDQALLYQFDGREAHLFRDDTTPGPIFPFDWSRLRYRHNSGTAGKPEAILVSPPHGACVCIFARSRANDRA